MKKSIDAIIDEVIIEPNKIQPIIVNFQNGELKDEEAKKMKVGLFEDEKNNKTVLALSNDQIVYKGYRPDNDKELTYTMLAIHNKKTGKIKLVQAERWTVAPVFDTYVDTDNGNEIDQMVELNKQFGSKKAKRKTEQSEKMKVNVENVKDQLEKTVSNIEIQNDELQYPVKENVENDLILPPINKNATSVSEIYNINDIVSEDILTTLHSQIDQRLYEKQSQADFFTKTVQHFKDDEKFIYKMAVLLYIEAVVFWLNNPIKAVKKLDIVVCPYSAEVNNHILETYSIASANGRLRPNKMKDKGIIHCLILGLMIWNFKLDLELFSTMFTFRIGIKKLLELAKWSYAVQSKDEKNIVLFKLPLPSQYSKYTKEKRIL